MPGWVLLVIIAVATVVMIVFRKPDRQRIDWKSMRLAMKRPHWAGKVVRTDHTQTITVELSELRPDQNAYLNKLIDERDVHAVADYLSQQTDWSREKAVDYAERVTGREYKE
jgi:flagellar motor switch protein FliG